MLLKPPAFAHSTPQSIHTPGRVIEDINLGDGGYLRLPPPPPFNGIIDIAWTDTSCKLQPPPVSQEGGIFGISVIKYCANDIPCTSKSIGKFTALTV